MILYVCGGSLSRAETDMIKKRAAEIKGCDHVSVTIDGDFLEVDYHVMPFERIRRITGYLVGTLDRFNDAKRAEVGDRVKHSSFDDI
jgi:hypothetical protein